MSYRTVARVGVTGAYRGRLAVSYRQPVRKQTLTPPPEFGRMSFSHRRKGNA